MHISPEDSERIQPTGIHAIQLPRDGSLSHLREQNLARVMQVLLNCRPLTRDQIERDIGIRGSSLTKLVEDLKKRELVAEGEAVQITKRGRPTRPLSLSRERWLLLGIILDKPVIQAVVSFLDLGIVESKYFPVPIGSSPARHLEELESVAQWAASVARQRGMELLAVELASPGAVSRSSGEIIRALPNAWGHVELASIMEAYLAKYSAGVHRSVAINIDRIANYSMIGRLNSMLQVSPDASFSGPIVYFGGRTALTGGLYDGSIFYGVTGLAGEYGHMVVDPGGIQCWCGRVGCLETKVGLLHLHAQRFQSNIPIDQLSAQSARLMQDLITARDENDEELLALLKEGGYWLSIAMDAIASVVNPAHMIIDGYMAQLGDPLISTAIANIKSLESFPAFKNLDITVTDGDPAWLLKGTLVAALRTVVSLPKLAT